MAGYENIKDYGFDKRTAEERRELAIKAGKASGETRRRKANFRKTLNQLLTAEIDSPEWTPLLESLGLDSTLETALNMAMIKKGLEGDVKAYETVARFAGQSAQTEADEEEQRIRTDRARRAKEQEVGDTDSAEENIQSFLRAMNPTQDELDSLFDDEEEEEVNAEDEEETDSV